MIISETDSLASEKNQNKEKKKRDCDIFQNDDIQYGKHKMNPLESIVTNNSVPRACNFAGRRRENAKDHRGKKLQNSL